MRQSQGNSIVSNDLIHRGTALGCRILILFLEPHQFKKQITQEQLTMSTTFPETAIENTHDSSQPTVKSESATAETLLIAPDDSMIVDRIRNCATSQAVSVLTLQGSDWPDGLAATISAAAKRGTKHVIVAGHSQFMAAASSESSSATNSESEASGGSIIARATSLQKKAQTARQHFAACLRSLMNSDQMRQLTSDSGIRVTPLFYVAHGDFFVRFDFESNAFVPLTNIVY